MNQKELGEDSAFLLYLAPVVASIIYGAYEWFLFGPHSSSMPITAYIIVSKDPVLFVLSLVAICIGFVMEVRGASSGDRTMIVSANTTRMQVLAVTVLIISFAAAISAGGYNVGNGTLNFLIGRYALIFAFFLIAFSIVLSPSQMIGSVKRSVAPEFLGLIFMALSPFVYYGALKVHLHYSEAAGSALVVLIVGIILVLGGFKIFKRAPRAPDKVSVASAPSA